VIDLKQGRLIARLVGLLAVLAIAILSLVPGDVRPHTGSWPNCMHCGLFRNAAAVRC